MTPRLIPRLIRVFSLSTTISGCITDVNRHGNDTTRTRYEDPQLTDFARHVVDPKAPLPKAPLFNVDPLKNDSQINDEKINKNSQKNHTSIRIRYHGQKFRPALSFSDSSTSLRLIPAIAEATPQFSKSSEQIGTTAQPAPVTPPTSAPTNVFNPGSPGGTAIALEASAQSPPDAGPPDAGPPDAGPPDAGPPDAGPPDAGPPDAGPPDAGPNLPATIFEPKPQCFAYAAPDFSNEPWSLDGDSGDRTPDWMPIVSAGVSSIACSTIASVSPCKPIVVRNDTIGNAGTWWNGTDPGLIRYNWKYLTDQGLRNNLQGTDFVLLVAGILAHEQGHYLDFQSKEKLSTDYGNSVPEFVKATKTQKRELWADYVAGCVLAWMVGTDDAFARYLSSISAIGDRDREYPSTELRKKAAELGRNKCQTFQ